MDKERSKKRSAQNIPGPLSLTMATPSSLFSKFSKYSKDLSAAGAAEKHLRGYVRRAIPFFKPPLNMTTQS